MALATRRTRVFGRTSRRLIALAIVLTAIASPSEAAEAPGAIESPDVLVIVNTRAEEAKDRRGSVTLVDPETHAALASMDTGLSPRWAAFGSDRRLLYVLNAGKAGFASPGALGTGGSLTAIDVVAQQVIASVPLDPFPMSALFSHDGERLFVICGGKGADQPATVTTIELATHESQGRIELGKRLGSAGLQPGYRAVLSRRGLLFVTRRPPFKKNQPSELIVVDTSGSKVVARHTLVPYAGRPWVSPHRDKVFVLAAGHLEMSKGARKGQLGKLYALDGRSGEMLGQWEAGYRPKVLSVDGAGRIFLAAGEDTRTLAVVIEPDGKETGIATLGRPLRVLPRPGGSDLLLLTANSVLRIDRESLEVVDQILPPFALEQMLVSADGSRVFVAEANGGKVAAVDLETKEWSKPLKSGRKGVKAGQALGSALSVTATIVLVAAAALDSALDDGAGGLAPVVAPFYAAEMMTAGPPLPVYTPPQQDSLLGLSGDDDLLFVLNQRTDDVTVVDTGTWAIHDKIPSGDGSRAMIASPNGRNLYVLAKEKLTVLEPGRSTKPRPETANEGPNSRPAPVVSVAQHKLDEKLRRIFVLRERNEFWLTRRRGIDVFALDTGELLASVSDLPKPFLVLDPAADR